MSHTGNNQGAKINKNDEMLPIRNGFGLLIHYQLTFSNAISNFKQ